MTSPDHGVITVHGATNLRLPSAHQRVAAGLRSSASSLDGRLSTLSIPTACTVSSAARSLPAFRAPSPRHDAFTIIDPRTRRLQPPDALHETEHVRSLVSPSRCPGLPPASESTSESTSAAGQKTISSQSIDSFAVPTQPPLCK